MTSSAVYCFIRSKVVGYRARYREIIDPVSAVTEENIVSVSMSIEVDHIRSYPQRYQAITYWISMVFSLLNNPYLPDCYYFLFGSLLHVPGIVYVCMIPMLRTRV